MNRLKINYCRICKSNQLETVHNLGILSFTGIFPKSSKSKVPKGKLIFPLREIEII